GIDHVGSVGDDLLAAIAMPERHRAHGIAIGIGSDRAIGLQYGETPAAAPGQEHGFDDGDADTRFGAEAADPAGAGIEIAPGAARFGQGIMVAIVLADAVAQLAIGAGDTELFDLRMLVGWHGLAGELAAQPVDEHS